MNKEDEDIVIEDDLDSVNYAEKEKKLREKIKQAEAKAKEYLDGWQRAQANFVNLRKRDDEAKAEFVKFAHADIMAQLVPVLDSFELSLPHGNKELEAVYNQFISILKSNGFEEQNPEGESFDPRFHESVGIVETENQDEDHKILEVIQKGYILIGKIIRPAKVKIGEYHG